jgi:hypothetical protein
MVCRVIVTVHSENHTKLKNTLFGQDAELLTIKAGDLRLGRARFQLHLI